jgi:hypothetical protein
MHKRRIDIMRRVFYILVIGLLMPAFGSCIFAPKEKPVEPGTGSGGSYLPLDDVDAPDNLLENLELSYNQRNFGEFVKLMDNSGEFTFFLGPQDIKPGKDQWGIGEELGKTQAMFDRDPPAGRPRASNIELDLIFGDEPWQPEDSPAHPDETWYSKPVEYVLVVQVAQTTFTQNKSVFALFTARFIDVDGTPTWQIVKWHDDVGN